ncbi:MAG: YitT family protein [Bacillota bacterium]
MLLTDAVITVAAAFIFGFERGTYAVLGVLANGFIIDYVIEGFSVSMQVIVISNNAPAIARFIMDDLGRGVTIFDARGGYSGRNMKVLYSVLPRKQFIQLREHIKRVAPRAFVTVSKSHQVIGEGFQRIV